MIPETLIGRDAAALLKKWEARCCSYTILYFLQCLYKYHYGQDEYDYEHEGQPECEYDYEYEYAY